MIYDDPNPSAAAPAKSRSPELPDAAFGQIPDEALREDGEASGGNIPANPPGRLFADEPGNISAENDAAPPATIRSRLQPAPAPQFDASIPEDLRTPWGWKDLLLFAGIGIAGLVIAEIVVGLAMYLFGVPFGELTSPSISSAKSIFAVLGQTLWSGLVLLYFFTMVRLKSQSSFWHTMGWRKLNSPGLLNRLTAVQCLAGGAMLAVIASIAGRLFSEKGELPIEEMFRSRPTVILLMLFGILVAPVVEETMFRGFLYPVIARRFGIGAGVAVTGILFGAMHAQQLWGGPGQIGLLVLVGIALTWVRAHTGTVFASYLVHLGYNSILFLGFFLATSGLQHIPGAR